MSDKLLALVDGSIYSKSVCDHAAWLADRAGWGIEILHVIGRRDIGHLDLSGSIALGARSALLAELSELDETQARLSREKGRAILEEAEAIVRQHGVSSVNSRLMSGDLVETLVEAEAGAAIVVVGKRGEAADFAKMHLGSNVERVVRSSSRPVLVASRAFQPIQSVLVAFDAGPSVMKAIDHICGNRAFAGLDIRLLTAGNENAEVRAKLESVSARLRGAGHSVVAEVKPGQPEQVIADEVEKSGADLLVMGAYGHSRIRNLFIGSTTSEMIRSCKIPVLLFR
ncbi:universal stress protein [Pelagibacterium sp. H642]|uniref:universal stress protein n=1 Tax=Pelagibacterium sp. H642 TaxID=1881069 RepID=UPI002815D80E|nr:universal stress protein [Pelagibacterium sp. H642]WMT90077.1 universal stress protein [Pelagibacterium sp. H642]